MYTRNPTSFLGIVALAVVCFVYVCLYQIVGAFPTLSERLVYLLALPFAVALILVGFNVGMSKSTRSKVNAFLCVILAVAACPPLVHFRIHQYPPYAYIHPEGTVELSWFRKQIFAGKNMRLTNGAVVAAYEAQNGKPILFFRTRENGEILLLDRGVDHGQLLEPCDRDTLDRYLIQEMHRDLTARVRDGGRAE